MGGPAGGPVEGAAVGAAGTPVGGRLALLNGPNLNLLGTREPHLYGTTTLAEIEDSCRTEAAAFGLELVAFQSNHEGALIDTVHGLRHEAAGIVVNPGGYAHTSVALADALAACELPVVEVHLTNVYRREAFRHHSFVSAVAVAVICGCGPDGYTMAVAHLAGLLGRRGAPLPAEPIPAAPGTLHRAPGR